MIHVRGNIVRPRGLFCVLGRIEEGVSVLLDIMQPLRQKLAKLFGDFHLARVSQMQMDSPAVLGWIILPGRKAAIAAASFCRLFRVHAVEIIDNGADGLAHAIDVKTVKRNAAA